MALLVSRPTDEWTDSFLSESMMMMSTTKPMINDDVVGDDDDDDDDDIDNECIDDFKMVMVMIIMTIMIGIVVTDNYYLEYTIPW